MRLKRSVASGRGRADGPATAAISGLTFTRLLGQAWTSRRGPDLQDGWKRIYLHHIRKTGGTSVTNAFLSLAGESPDAVEWRLVGRRPRATQTGGMVIAAHDRLALQAGWYTYGWSHVPAWRMRLRPRTYTVTVLREPTARALSLYRYLADPDADRGHAFGAAREERELTAGGFDRFLDLVAREDLLNQLYMFSERLDPAEAAERIGGCSLVFFLEDLGHGMETLSALIGRPLPELSERRSSSRFQPTEAQRDRLRELLEPEYRLMDLVRPIAARHQAGGARLGARDQR